MSQGGANRLGEQAKLGQASAYGRVMFSGRAS
jgi:hypothetical protein